jgi:hypothetical protein
MDVALKTSAAALYAGFMAVPSRCGWGRPLSHIYDDGRLGCIQPIGEAPGAFTATSSYLYGIGAFLLAGSEIYKLSD